MVLKQSRAALSVIVIVLSLTLCAGFTGAFSRYRTTYPNIVTAPSSRAYIDNSNGQSRQATKFGSAVDILVTPENNQNNQDRPANVRESGSADLRPEESETETRLVDDTRSQEFINSSESTSPDNIISTESTIQKVDSNRESAPIRQSEEDNTIYYVIGTRFFSGTDPRKLSQGARNAYTGKCELLIRIAVPSVMLAIDDLYAHGNKHDNVRIRWQFDSELMLYDATCVAAVATITRRFKRHTQNYKQSRMVEIESFVPEAREAVLKRLDTVTKWEGIHFGDYRTKKVFDISRNGVLVLSRFDSDDAINRIAFLHIIDSIRGDKKGSVPFQGQTKNAPVPGSVKDRGFYYVSLPDTANFAVKHGGPCGSLTRCDYCLHKGLMQTHAIYGPKFDACRSRTDYSNCLHTNRVSLYNFQHNKVNEYFTDHIVQHFPKCNGFDQCRSYLCGDGTEVSIKPDGSMKQRLRDACKQQNTPMALYTQSGLQDSADSPSAWNATATEPSIKGTAVCTVLRDLFGIEFPILDSPEPTLARCLQFEHRNDPECVR
ncbi:hypothetical protein SARC_06138 [Sphaeroforma arctica JP610]|uniref:Uncharacterized protein n=1 Tax=Sphaeroforma arctica JP610 TaxID=667725 RepID=A0A0L0G007_9EUKA|nr:hypothetical protein SARC_06138 [Sphaeroforma arctica JP610]KNC81548.1 hypothetical protein SARC_06138 [Sphaeroforma arctica JP610]|eukprot:XP_014155450.1 hypothetical protein SARC_06138 [Sphaeroforma arctica JP610]